MGPELPPALSDAIARELGGMSGRALADRAAATSATYRAGGTSAAAIRGRDDALAYALARAPATYAACARVFAEARRRLPEFAPASLLDAGAGPGGGSWAALEAWPSLAQIQWVDSSPPFLDLARRLAAEGPAPLRAAEARRLDLTGAELPRRDLVLASYALAEIAPAALPRVVDSLWEACTGVLALVEPGTPAGYARLRDARDTLIRRAAAIVAPCPHQNGCPLSGADWCHFSVRLPRSRDHRLAKSADAPFEDEKFAYLLAARPMAVGEAVGARVLARPRAGKPGIELKLCTAGGLEIRFVGRRDKATHARARRLAWGDAFDAPQREPSGAR